jgi:hypothetical protein
MRTSPATRDQQCGLHLLDLCRAYPRDPATPAALALLEEYRIRGAELRRLAELKAAAERALVPVKLAPARRAQFVRARGGLVQPAKQRPPRPRGVARRPRGPIAYHAPRWPIETGM